MSPGCPAVDNRREQSAHTPKRSGSKTRQQPAPGRYPARAHPGGQQTQRRLEDGLEDRTREGVLEQRGKRGRLEGAEQLHLRARVGGGAAPRLLELGAVARDGERAGGDLRGCGELWWVMIGAQDMAGGIYGTMNIGIVVAKGEWNRALAAAAAAADCVTSARALASASPPLSLPCSGGGG